MATSTTYFTDLKKLYHGGYNLLRCFFANKEVYEAYHNGEKVFNRALYTLSGEDITIEATGTGENTLDVVANVLSYKTDRDGTIANITYLTKNAEVINPNYTDKEKSGSFTIIQNVTGQDIILNWTQEPEELIGTDVSNPWGQEVSIEEAFASGGNLTVTMNCGVTYTTRYTSGREEVKQGQVLAEVTKIYGGMPDNVSSGVTVDGATVIVPNLGTTPMERRKVYLIWRVDGKCLGKDVTWTSPDGINYLEVWLNANTRNKTGESDWSTLISPTTETVEAGYGYKRYFTGSCHKYVYYLWSSGSDGGYDTLNGNCTVVGTTCSVSPTSFDGRDTTITMTTYNNTNVSNGNGVSRNIYVKINGQGNTSATATIKQAAGDWVLTTTNAQIGSSGGTVNIIGTSTCNGEYQPVVATGNGVTIGNISYSETTYSVPVTIGANSGGARTFDITIKNAAKTVTAGIAQTAGVVRKPAIAIFENAIYTSENSNVVSYSFYLDATNETLYYGGTFENVKIRLRTNSNGTEIDASSSNTIGTVTVANGSKSDVYSGTLTVNPGYVGLYIWIEVYSSIGIHGIGEIEDYNLE